MKKLIGAALAAGATLASAGAVNAGEISANIGLTTDYVFRGVSLSGNDPAVQGGFDWNSSSETIYAGVWGSSLSSGMEMDVYAGWTPDLGGPFSLDLGAIGYFYPGADDDGAEFDYWELKASTELALSEQMTVGGAVYWAPDNYGETGDALYLEINAGFAASEQLEFNAAFGNQSIEDPDGPLLVTDEDDYSTWNIGGTYAMHGFSLDLRYHDTDIDAGSDIESYTFGPSSYDSAVVFTIGREL
ncbi:hypothetical protein U91I_03675 [alpha proteobacterium U9-1i]|nr:hypothetical protein U91I_03675 [alpha proteobacterium U9-1i]